MRRLALLAVVLVVGAAAAGEPVRVMPLGDSITEASRGEASWRYWLGRALEREGRRVDFVGSQRGVLGGAPRFPDFDQDHEGHWGWTTGQVLAEIDGWARSGRPDVVLIHLGTNDVRGRPEDAAKNLATIVDRFRAENPKIVLLVARIIPMDGAPRGRLDALNAAIEAMARGKYRDDSPVVIVRQDEGFDPATDTSDGIHPNESGEKKMAARWLEALRPFVPKADGVAGR